MRFKDQMLKIVQEQNPIKMGIEWQRVSAEYSDNLTALREQLSEEQCYLLENITKSVEELLTVREEWTFYKTFDEITKAWRTLILDEDYITSIDELMG